MSDRDNYDDSRIDRGDRDIQPKPTADRWLSIEIHAKANQPELLQGLEQWLQLNLITQGQVKKIARRHLSCALPAVEVVKSIEPVVSIAEVENRAIVKAAQPNILQKVLQGFLDELSIRWLLFLGIFLVVVSSGVLAASQWQNFPVFGQYLVLFIYTLGFWGIGFWTGKQGLNLTSQTLSAIATLLIPINFWAISHLGLGNNSIEWLVIAVVGIVLTATILFSRRRKTSNNLFNIAFLLLSYLHLAWKIPFLPIASIYGGIVIISLFRYRFLLPKRKYSVVNLLFILASWSILLTRRLISNIEVFPNYCLAIAIFAWLIATVYLTQVRKTKFVTLKRKSLAVTNTFIGKIGKVFGIILFSFTWLFSLLYGLVESPLFIYQTVVISLLAIHLFSQRLALYWRKRDLTAIFLIGLQTLYICKELIPDRLSTQALDLSVAVSKTAYFPESVFSVTLFPYVILFVSIATWLYRQQKNRLALHAEYLTLMLGIVLTCLSIFNPTWRSLNLLLSTLTLGYVARIRQPVRNSLIYLTHLLGLVTVINAIAVILPDLSKPVWGSIFVVLMAIEWGIKLSWTSPKLKLAFSLFRQSCWYFGLLLGAVSYTCLSQIETSFTPNSFRWGLVWLTAPAMLTLIARRTRNMRQRRLATIVSCVALILAQLLIFGRFETRLIGLAVAVGLMFSNAFNLRRTIVTVIHLGFALSLIATLFDLVVGNRFISNWYWLSIAGAAILCLYRLRIYLRQKLNNPKFDYISQRSAYGILGVGVETQNYKLIDKYIKAADYWAIALMAIDLTIISIIYLAIPYWSYKSDILFPYLLTTCLLSSAVLWRYRQQPHNLVLYTLVWLGELFAVGLLLIFGGSNLDFATVNIIFGLVSLLAVGWLAQSDSPWTRLDLSYVPLVYAGLGIIWRLSYFNAYTGWLTLGAASILLNTRQRNRQVNYAINYLGFAGISFGIYELVIYQMRLRGGSIADALTILSLVAAAIAFTYRLATYWYRQRNYQTLLNLSLSKVVPIAHLHWAISSMFKIVAAGMAIESTALHFTFVSIATSFCLGAYAVIQGRDREVDTSEANDWWVYVGLVEIAATLVYSRLIITKLSLFDPWRIIFTCAVALLIYQIPWQSFGWRATPWQRTALITPILVALVTAEGISDFSLLITALFYLRIAVAQRNIRWSYISLGLFNWGMMRLVWQLHPEAIWQAAIVSFSILYIAQFDRYFKSHRAQRHQLRIIGSSILAVTALFYPSGIIPGAIAFILILLGLGLQIRAFLFVGTIALVLTAVYQLILLVATYSFLKWIVGLLAGICSIAIAAGFEQQRDRALNRWQSYQEKLQNWQ